MRCLIIAAYILIFFTGAAQAQEHFFEPNQRQWDNAETNSLIKKQEARYLKAMKAHAYRKAEFFAIYFYEIAWAQLAEANILHAEKKYKEEMSKLKMCLLNCKEHSSCDPGGRHKRQQKKIEKHVFYDIRVCQKILSVEAENGEVK